MSTEKPVLLFDGLCGLCGIFITWLVRHDKERKLLYVPRESDLGVSLQHRYSSKFSEVSVIRLIEAGVVYEKSDAIFRAMIITGKFSLLSRLLLCVPRGVRDFVYMTVSRNRYKLFGKHESCAALAPDIKGAINTQ